MEPPIINSQNISDVDVLLKHDIYWMYIRSIEDLNYNIKSLQRISNLIKLADKDINQYLNSPAEDNVILYWISDEINIYAFCFVQLKGYRNNRPFYRLSFLTVDSEFKSEGYEKQLFNKIILDFKRKLGCIYAFVPKIIENKNGYFQSLYKHNELSRPADFPEDPTAWLDDNGKQHLPHEAWNCFWYPKNPLY
jgi:hypothetical protein